jgi:hypothetical protein
MSAGRYLFGLAGIGFGLCGLIWHDFNTWQQLQPIAHDPQRGYVVDAISALEIAGGIAILWLPTMRLGAAVLGVVYLAFGLMRLPAYIHAPAVYDNLGNFFEQFSMASGALIVVAAYGVGDARAQVLARIGYFGFAVSVVSFTLEQLIYLRGTADFIPPWIPFHMFFAVATTLAFALAAIALFSGRQALLAARLATVMIVGFGVLVWFPAPASGPHDLNNWAGIVENFGICAAAWIVAEYLQKKSQPNSRN